jgi:hypothetical protein
MSRWRDTHGKKFELLRHFLVRFFDSELITTPGQWVSFIIKSLPFVAAVFLILVPALNGKYRHVIAMKKPALYQSVVLGDELWLISLSMGLIGLLAAIQWQSLFPGRLDYLVLGSLPVKPKQIFLAKLEALLIVAGIFILVINAFPSVMFPIVSANRFTNHPPLLTRIAVHGFTCILASYFFFFALIGCQALLSNLLPRRRLAQVSSWVQGLLITLMLAVITLSFSIGPAAGQMALRPENARWLPPVWFLGLYQRLSGDPDPRFADLAARAWAALGIAVFMAIAACLIGYERQRKLVSEGAEAPNREGKLSGALLDRLVPEPRQQAVLMFMLKTLARSSQHRMLLVGYCGLGAALTLSGVAGIGALVRTQRVVIASFVYAHSILLILAFLGLRHLFAIPSELRANWTFQITEREGRGDWLRVVERFVLGAAAALVLLLPLPLEVALTGWRAISETTLFAVALLLSYELLFMEWEKLPFTCSYLPGKSPGMMLLFLVAGLMGILPIVNYMIVSAVYNPLFFVILLALLSAGSVWARHTRKMVWGQLKLAYDDAPEPAVRSLSLGMN